MISPSDQRLVPAEQSVSNTIETLHSFKILRDCEVTELHCYKNLQKSHVRRFDPIPLSVLHGFTEVFFPSNYS